MNCMYVLLYLTSYVVVEEERTSVCMLLSTRYVMYYVMLLGTNMIIINQGLGYMSAGDGGTAKLGNSNYQDVSIY